MDEGQRLRALDRYGVLDTADEPRFDAITRVVARTLGVPIALVSLVDRDRQWFKSCIGLDVRETPRSIAFCAHAIRSSEVFVVPDATADERFATNPLVTGPPSIRSYAGAPLVTPAGERIGTLCAIDRRPRVHTADELATLRDLASVVVELLEQRLLEREKQILARIAEVSPNGAFIYDIQRRALVWTTPGFQQLIGDAKDFRARVDAKDQERLDHYDFSDETALEVVPFFVRGLAGQPDRALLSRRMVFERDEHGRVRTIIGVLVDVTDLHAADQRLRASERALADRVLVLEGILESAPVGIMYVDQAGKLLLANPRARELRNDNAAEIADEAAVSHIGVFGEDHLSLMTPSDLPLMRALRGEAVDVESLFIRNARYPAGVHIKARARAIRDADGTLIGAVASLADVTALRVAQERLARALENVTAIIEALPLAILVRRDDRIVYANPAFERLVDRDAASLVGLLVEEIVAPADRSLVADRMRCIAAGGTVGSVELRVLGTSGPVLVESRAMAIDYDNEDAVLIICRDITLENHARQLADASLREKEALLQEIHHRVKNSLSVVASLLFIQAQASGDIALRHALEQSMARVRSIGLVHEQLYRTRVFERLDLGAYLKTLVSETMSTLAGAERGISIQLRAEPAPVNLDIAMPCGLIVNELLTNAVKHAFPARTGSVVVDVRPRGSGVRVTVTDDGIGFDATQPRSASLGLELIRDLCEQLGATWTLSTTQGTTFTLEVGGTA